MNENEYKFDPMTGEPIVKETTPEQPQYETPQYEAAQYEAPRYEAPQYETPQYEAPQNEVPQYQAPQQEYAPQETYAQKEPETEQGGKVKGIVSLVLGVLSIIFCWFGIIYFVLALLALGASIAGSILGKNAPAPGKAGRIISIFGIVFSAICTFIGLFVVAFGM